MLHAETISQKAREEDKVLEIRDLKVNFHTYRGEVKALNGVNLAVYKHEVLAVVGESGCGKSVTALTVLSLLPENAYIIGGKILLNEEDLLKKSKDEMTKIRASEIATVFQDPMTFLNPVLTIRNQLEEVFTLDKNALKHAALALKAQNSKFGYSDFLAAKGKENQPANDSKVSRGELKKATQDLCMEVLKIVKLPDPERMLRQYPFELSGGMRQRCMIAMALARRPSLFIADEITTALDVTIQAQILHLLRELRDTIGATTLMITHDLAVAAEIADRIAVMYGGHVAEVAPTNEIFRNPLHPYTQLLMKAIPNVTKPVVSLETIPGTVPEMINPPPGCPFHPRCPYAMVHCVEAFPETMDWGQDHEVACYLYGD
jgi:peptide/nickel transport system ATP-binding protein